MAKPAKLKVFRTAIGFHDAYVAAPSKKAALTAWGSDKDLFARGIAELVTDPKLATAALDQPGVVLKVSRGSAEEQFAALSKTVTEKTGANPSKTKARFAPIRPRPSRAALDDAEAKLAAIEQSQRADLQAIDAQERELARKRERLIAQQATETKKAVKERDRLNDRYDRAIAAWRES